MQPFELVKHCPRCGHPSGVKAAIPFVCANCHLKLYFNTAVSASAFILNERGEILFIRRAKEPGKGMLATIGGFIDAGETAENALRREILEEVHLEISEIEFLVSHPNSYTYAEVTYPVLDLFFLCRISSDAQAQAGDDVLSVVWKNVHSTDPADLAFESMRQAFLILKRKLAD
ncbi:MAG: hypothetical protein K0Q55_2581 [Verrucomicrobia bacterium]|jgi:ADP-ribose pyrophosphatase YjhB (NUDIX family)|nr:hypothetical protein [Verrucomicrobiota bacterium]